MNNFKILKHVSMAIDKREMPHLVSSDTTKAFALYMAKEWRTLANPLIKKSGDLKQTEKSVNSFLKSVDTEMGKYGGKIEDEVDDYITFLYKFAKDKFIKDHKLDKVEKVDLPEISPVIWAEVDELAITQLKKITNGAAGKFYSSSVQQAVHESVKVNMFDRHLTHDDAITAIKKDLERAFKLKGGALESKIVPKGFKGTANQYFSGLAEYSSSMARTSSSIYTMQDVGVEKVVIRSLKSARTCVGCLEMDGTVYKTKDVAAHMDKMLAVNDVSELKELQPFFHFDTPGNSTDKMKEDAKKVSGGSVKTPPFHFLCECFLDMET